MAPPPDRFHPTRAGIVNIWDYSDEEFVFADGRLVLRGHNGSGKTKALEVLFPFVLDGFLDARRLDPFSGENRTMKSNLLYRGQDAEYGYVWMEFARPGGETATLIVGMRAQKNLDGVRPSFFVTDKRMGVDFGLLTSDSRPFTEKQLRGVLGAEAACDGATAYRAAVDARLFGLGRRRYTQLLDLLLALRRPLLAKDLDPVKVSETLTAGLSPVEDDLVGQAARDFENLAAVQRRFDDATTADAAARAFLDDYTRYLRTRTKAKLDRIERARETATGHLTNLAEAMATRGRAEADHGAAVAERDRLAGELADLRRRLDGLKQDENYLAHGDIERQRTYLTQAAEEIEQEQRRLQQTRRHVASLEHEAQQQAEHLERLREQVTGHATALGDAAERSGIAYDGDGPPDTGDDLPTTARARSAARRSDVEHLRSHLSTVAAAEKDRGKAEAARDRADQAATTREEECRTAEAELEKARGEARTQLEAWTGHWTAGVSAVADGDDASALAEALERLGEAGAPTPAEIFTERTEQRHRRAVQAAERCRARVAELEREAERLRGEREEIAAERDDAPPADSRRPADRDGRPGAPLWRLVRFADGVDAGEAAGVEGALYGAGLLTAWLHPAPALTREAIAAAEADGYLLALAEEDRPDGRTLADVLVPEDQDAVPAAAITAVLRSIAVHDALAEGAPTPAVSAAARFGYGVHAGAFPKPEPEYIGATNRENRRKARLAACDEAIGQTRQRHEGAAEELAVADDHVDAFARARTALPQPGPVLKAGEQASHQATLLVQARIHLDEQQQTYDTAVATVDTERRRLRQAGAERSMPTAADGIAAVDQAVTEFAEAAEHLHATRAQVATVHRDVEGRRETIAQQRDGAEERAEALQAKQDSTAAERAELQAREEAMAAPVQEVLAEVGETEQRIRALSGEHEGRERAAHEADHAKVRAQAVIDSTAGPLAESFGGYFENVAEFGPYAHGDLRPLTGVGTADPWPQGVDWPSAEQAARAAADALSQAPESAEPAALVRAQLPSRIADLLDVYAAVGESAGAGEAAVKEADGRLSAALREFEGALASCSEDYRVDHESTGVVLVHVSDEAGRNPVSVFAHRMADLVAEQGALLEDRERSVLEDELLTELAQQIHERVRTARDLVRGMDRDTRSRPMSSGTKVGIRWVRADHLDERQARVAGVLERDSRTLGSEGLAELRGLLREMIRDYRADHARATYRQAVAHVVDYRTWYTFELMLAEPGEKDVKLTRARHTVMSGGEKSAAIHLPLFAAANALYSSAYPTCPRMIALDEAFAGIDDRYKPDLLGLTVKFDLDMFMTGHDLWVHYDSVPMAAHYDMHHDKAAHAVSAMLMLWDGEQTVDADAGFSGNDELVASLLGIAPSRHAPANTEGTLLQAAVQDDDESDGDGE
ncbi:SbcC/MukB-like Walker B domain-containing protein [Streptomonospora litoralis]|uniref:Chromosome segregation protein n=1 Tax=Streptomonospora litoralis TaxID=2498135 RepID=A0A4P6Q742_9ACTN|nr:SbcC/MukB-like Walker B domain-containing protein [Streptomonospora litoralis]QBI56606.1 chromosome segregation protein [Streptomonospora litoralis]